MQIPSLKIRRDTGSPTIDFDNRKRVEKADIADGVYDKMIDQNGDVEKTNNLSNTIFKKTNRTIAYIENNETDDALKRKYLGRIIENLKLFNTDINDGIIDISFINPCLKTHTKS